MSGPQPWKGNTYSKGQGQPFQPRETPVQRGLRRKHGEKQVEERTEHPQKNRTECQRECREGRRNSRANDKIWSGDERTEQQCKKQCGGLSNLKNRTANPTRRNGMGNNPMTCSAEDLAKPSPALFGDLFARKTACRTSGSGSPGRSIVKDTASPGWPRT